MQDGRATFAVQHVEREGAGLRDRYHEGGELMTGAVPRKKKFLKYAMTEDEERDRKEKELAAVR